MTRYPVIRKIKYNSMLTYILNCFYWIIATSLQLIKINTLNVWCLPRSLVAYYWIPDTVYREKARNIFACNVGSEFFFYYSWSWVRVVHFGSESCLSHISTTGYLVLRIRVWNWQGTWKAFTPTDFLFATSQATWGLLLPVVEERRSCMRLVECTISLKQLWQT